MQAMGLSLVNNTNLSYFKSAHKAEIFKLKGMLYEAQNDIDKAHQLYFTSIDLKDDEASAWLCWGRLCAARHERGLSDIAKARSQPHANHVLVRFCHDSAATCFLNDASAIEWPFVARDFSTLHLPAKRWPCVPMRQCVRHSHAAMQITEMTAKQHEYGENALACFFQALRYDAAASASIVPRMLAMMAFNSNKERDFNHLSAPMAQVVKEEIAQSSFPAAVLLPYLTYLVESLLRGEREMSKRLLNLVAGKFPQSLYLPMRTSLLHLRDCVTKWMKEEERARPAGEQVLSPPLTSLCPFQASRFQMR
jgi:hypothetical protein